jgi:hypothetical protein
MTMIFRNLTDFGFEMACHNVICLSSTETYRAKPGDLNT